MTKISILICSTLRFSQTDDGALCATAHAGALVYTKLNSKAFFPLTLVSFPLHFTASPHWNGVNSVFWIDARGGRIRTSLRTTPLSNAQEEHLTFFFF